VDQTFQYLVPPELAAGLTEGMRVVVPFGSRRLHGYVVELTSQPAYDVSKLKSVISISEESVAI